MACQGNSEGLAPSTNSPVPLTPTSPSSASNSLKYGETVTTASGWVVSLDTADSTETVMLSNGWTVEVAHE